MQSQSAGSHLGVTFEAITHVGMRRSNNQDSVCAAPATTDAQWSKQGHLFVVADGMGAHAAGELASKMATDLVVQTYRKLAQLSPLEALEEAIQEANRQIHGKGQSDEEFRGMGTTVCALVLLPRKIIVANVGDSRVYRLRDGRFEQLTFDHSLVWELRAAQPAAFEEHELECLPKNVITRSLGPHPEVKVDLQEWDDLRAGDVYVLCTDGLSGPVADENIGKVARLFPPKEAAQLLVHLANFHGGPDNISVIVVRVDSVGPAGRDSRKGPGERGGILLRAIAALLIFLLLGAAALAGILWKHWLGMFSCLGLAAGVTAGWVGWEWLIRRRSASRQPQGVLHSGPFRSYSANVDQSFVGYLADVAEALAARGQKEQWSVDWQSFNHLYKQAQEASAQNEVVAAASAYGRAIVDVMNQLFAKSSTPYSRRWPRGASF